MALRFAFYCYVEQWPQVIEEVSQAEPHLRAIGRDAAADLLVRAYGKLQEDLKRLAITEAVAGTATLREFEKRTRVRADSHGGGGPRLSTSLYTRAIDTGGLLPGSIGIADLETLDSLVPWWITNEIGSSKRVGGRLFGTFSGGASPGPPDAGQFRQHALFESGAGPDAGLGIIERPIPARRFIEASVKLINAEWKAEFQAIRARFETRLDEVARTYR